MFLTKPVDDWRTEAARSLVSLSQTLGRPVSPEVTDRFLDYVEVQQQVAKLRASFQETMRKVAIEKSLPPKHEDEDDEPELADTLLDLTQMGLDLVGLFDPTPASDGTNTIISAGRGQWGDMGINAVSMIPYLGDLAKLGKLGKYPKQIAKAIALARKNIKAGKAIKPVMKELRRVLKRVPLEKLPKQIRKPLEELKTKVDNFFRVGRSKGNGSGKRARQARPSRGQISRWSHRFAEVLLVSGSMRLPREN